MGRGSESPGSPFSHAASSHAAGVTQEQRAASRSAPQQAMPVPRQAAAVTRSISAAGSQADRQQARPGGRASSWHAAVEPMLSASKQADTLASAGQTSKGEWVLEGGGLRVPSSLAGRLAGDRLAGDAVAAQEGAAMQQEQLCTEDAGSCQEAACIDSMLEEALQDALSELERPSPPARQLPRSWPTAAEQLPRSPLHGLDEQQFVAELWAHACAAAQEAAQAPEGTPSALDELAAQCMSLFEASQQQGRQGGGSLAELVALGDEQLVCQQG